jgi:hypothetical protein
LRSIKGNGLNEKIREYDIIQQQPHKEEDAENAEVQDARQDEHHKCEDNGTYHSISDACNHKIRMKKKVTYPSGA